MFSILNELRNPTPTRTTAVVVASIGTASATYILVAITGYLSFGTNVVGNIVSQYTPSVASTVGRAAIVVLVMFSYPLQVHPCRASVDAVSKWRPTTRRVQELTPATSSRGSPNRNSAIQIKVPVTRPKSEDMTELRFAVITTIIIILSYIAAMTINSLDKVLAYVGATGSTSISFILPGLFYYKISSPDSPHHQRLLKDEDDEEYDGSGSSGSDDEAYVTDARQRSWTDTWTNRFKAILGRKDVLRHLSLALAIYGLLVLVVCLCTNIFFQASH